jgi:hypothetical protein
MHLCDSGFDKRHFGVILVHISDHMACLYDMSCKSSTEDTLLNV